MTLDEIVADIILKTNRPDMGFVTSGGDGRIPSLVMDSTQALHNADFFYKDIKTAQVVFDAAAYVQVLDLSTLPRYRSLSYVRKNDPSLAAYQQNPTLLPPLVNSGGFLVANDTITAFLDIITPTDILDDYGTEKLDVAYQVGNNLMIKSSTSLRYALVGWYSHPYVSKTNYTAYDSWIAREFPSSIIFDCVASVFGTIGKAEQAALMRRPPDGDAVKAKAQLIASNITPVGS